jgi:hypothetical protein
MNSLEGHAASTSRTLKERRKRKIEQVRWRMEGHVASLFSVK